MKTCSKCGEEKPFEYYGTRNNRKNPFQPACKICTNAMRDKDKQRAYDKIKYLKIKSKKIAYNRIKRWKRLYGLIPEDYNSILESQLNSCAICKINKPDAKTTFFAVDHCHATGLVRGLLCSNCNRGLGMFKDNTSILRIAINYLERNKV